MMRKLSLRCQGSPNSLGVATPPVSSLSPTNTPAKRLVSSRSLGSTASPPLTPAVNIPPCLPSHQHHAILPPTPGPPSHRSLPALHPVQDMPCHPLNSIHASDNPTYHGSHPMLHHHSSPPISRPSHSPYPSSKCDCVQPRQLPGVPRHNTIGGRILPPAPTSSMPPTVHVPPQGHNSSSSERLMVSPINIAVRPTHVLRGDNYKYSRDVPRTSLRDTRCNTYPPPGVESSPPSHSPNSGSTGTSGPSSSGSQMSPSETFSIPMSPRLSSGFGNNGGRVSPLVMTAPPIRNPVSPGHRSSSLSSTSPIPRMSPIHISRSPLPPRSSPSHCCSPASLTRVSPTTPHSRKSSLSLEPPVSPLLRKTTRPPLMRSHATVG